jgi:rhomboid protease GluP
MDYDIVIFWFVVFSCLSALVMVLTRLRHGVAGWVVVYLSILLVAVVGSLCRQPTLIHLAAGMWFLLVLTPGLMGRLYHQRFLQQRYSGARKLAQIISWLHPADGWRTLPEIIRALELAQRGELTGAQEILKRFQDVKSVIGLAAVTNLYQLTNQWEELWDWQTRNLPAIERHPSFLPSLLRAKGETGDVRGLIELYDRHQQQIRKLVPASARSLCRLMLFAFCGRRQPVERLVAGSLAVLPASTREFWLATSDMMAGKSESAKRQFEQLLPVADPPLRQTIQRRLARLSILPSPLDALAEGVVEEAAREHDHDENFGAQRSLFSNRARATQILIGLNVLMFALEISLGGGTNMDTLYRLGALFPPAVHAGQWWRLIAALFLHYGWLHIAMNMLALGVLGPFVEFALGFRRYFFVYLLSGIGSMGAVMWFGSGPDGQQMSVGASGCIMGLVGATGALMLRGWRRHKALSAKRRLTAILLIVLMQTFFDSVVPQVSMTAHLSGALIGFAAALMLRDRLVATAPQSEAAAALPENP